MASIYDIPIYYTCCRRASIYHIPIYYIFFSRASIYHIISIAGGDQADVGGREEQEGRAVADQPRQETTSVVFRQFLVRSGKFFYLDNFWLEVVSISI